MADAQSVVELVFQGVDRTGEATAAALRNVDSFGGSLQRFAQPLADFTESALKFEAALLATGAAVATFAVKAAGDFDASFREIATLIDEPIDALGEFRGAIIEYGSGSTQSLEEITRSVYSAISAGVDYTDSLDVVRQAEQLALAGRADLSESLLVLVSSLNAYGESTDQAQRYSDLLFQTVKLGQTTLPELAQNLSQVTGTAATLEVPFQTVLAAIATLTASGTPTAQAVTQINAALSALIEPSAEAQTLAAELGIEFDAQAVKAKGLEGVLQEVAEATGGNEQEMGKLFGSVEALRAVFPLTGTAAEKFATNLEAMENSAGATERAVEKMAGSFTQTNQQVANALNLLLIEIGTPLLDEYGSIAAGIAAIFNSLAVEVQRGQLGELAKFVEGIMGDVGKSLLTFAENLPAALGEADLSGFKSGLEAVVDGVKKLFSGLELDTVDGVKRAIEALGGAFAVLGEYTGQAIEMLKPIVDLMVDTGVAANESDRSWVTWAGTVGGLSLIVAPLATALSSIATAAILAGPALATMGARLAFLGTIKYGVIIGGLGWIASNAIKIYDAAKTIAEANERIEEFNSDPLLQFNEEEVGRKFQRISEELGYTITSMEEFEQAVESGADVTGQWVSAINLVSQSTGDLAGSMDNSAVSAEELNAALGSAFGRSGYDFDPLTGAVRGLTEGTQQAAEAAGMAEEATRGYVMELVDGVPTFRQVGTAASSGFGEAAKAAEEATRASETYLLKMEEIASNERIALIEAKFAVDVAQIEADAQRVQAAFESIDNTVNSTGELIGELFGLLGDASRWDKLEIFDQIEKENERRDAALELQKQLTEAEIKLLRARADSLDRGDSLIQIDGAGLQPHLEAFMWEILRSIQVRVNQDGLDLLMGV
jgi:TP901 family phage tail tape measure protein